MSRIELLYGGHIFTVAAESADEVKRIIGDAFASGAHRWLTVNRGEGRAQTAELLVGPGIPIAVVPQNADDENNPSGPTTVESLTAVELD